MTRSTIYRVAAAAAVTAGLVACDNSTITNINVDPNRPTDAPAGAVFTNAAQLTIARWLGSGYSFSQTELVAQHLAKTQYPDEDRYARLLAASTQGSFNNPYTGELENLRQVVKKGQTLNWAGTSAPAMVLQALGFQYLTDTFGDVPFSAALAGDSIGGSLAPAYDTQQSIYTGLFSILTNASKALSTPSSSDPGLGGADPLYGGDFTKWQKFANSLHARLAMRIVNVDPATADKELRAAMAAPGGLFASNADNATVRWPGDGVFDNSWATVAKTRDDNRMSQTLMNVMLPVNDPRIPIFAMPTVADPTKYAGMPNGLSTSAAGFWFNTASRPGAMFYPGVTAYGTYGGKGASLPSFAMTYAEVQFILAEAAERGIAGLSQSAAAGYYKAGITASIQQWAGASGQAVPQSAIDAFLAQPSMTYSGGTAGLKQIAVQRWVALYTDGGNAWFEWRRTCQPSTIAAGPAAIVNYVPRRFQYSTTEASVNAVNLAAAIARQGPDNFATRVWWDTKPTAAPTCN
ncbi:MAG: SusD/RagB family nutrient-binding outer membrane lipoprotein [Gemmatimonadaceae bacterium]|nr:SusD/RagB family nutrient-binding outer membrane lipoprotein [Gemmatimonadaceae bacterium]